MQRGEAGFYAVVFGAHGIGAVDAFEPADREMAARQVLEMLGESKVEGSPAHCAGCAPTRECVSRDRESVDRLA